MKKTVKISIDEKLDSQFRELAKKKYPGKRFYSKAVEDAIRLWIKKEEKAYIVYRNLQLLEEGVELKRE